MMIDEVVCAQYINIRHTDRQLRRYSNSHPNALRRAAKIHGKPVMHLPNRLITDARTEAQTAAWKKITDSM